MFEAFLVTTSSEGLQPLGSAAQRSFELVSGTVRDRLGPAHAEIFAEPVPTRHGDRIDWHAAIRGSVHRLTDLPEPDRAGLRDVLGSRVADIRALAEELGASGDDALQRLSEALSNATEIPGEDMIYAVRDGAGTLHPVLVHWAWLRDRRKAVRGVLTGMVPRKAAAAQPRGPLAAAAGPGTAAAAVVWPWWLLILLGWLLLALLLAAILYLMIAPCGLSRAGLVYCPAPAAGIGPAESETAVIEDEIAALQRDLGLMRRSCQPAGPAGPVPVPGPHVPGAVPPAPDSEATPAPDSEAPPAPDSEAARRAREAAGRRAVARGAARGDLNFALEWRSRDDIDLFVTCPAGQTLSYRLRRACNGRYDLDANVVRRLAVGDPVENVVFDDPAPGPYRVKVELRAERSDGPKEFTLHVLRRDGQSQSLAGTLGGDRREWTTTINVTE